MSQEALNTLRENEDWKDLPENSKDLTDAQINNIFRKEYFDRLKIDKLVKVPGLEKEAPKLAEQVFDSGVQHGIDDSGRWLQKSLDETLGTDLGVPDDKGNLIYDGNIGPKTRTAVARAVREGKIKDVNNMFADKRFNYMKTLSNFDDNDRGWKTRVDNFRMP